jgi:hypothetical protein
MERPALKPEIELRLAKGENPSKPAVLFRRSLQKPDRTNRDLDFAAA